MLPDTLHQLLAHRSVTDIHVEEGQLVWYRELGQLKAIAGSVVSRQQILDYWNGQPDVKGSHASLEQALAKSGGDLDFAVTLGPCRVRGNLYRVNEGCLAFALRKLNNHIPEAGSLGLPDNFIELTHRSKGLFLVTGGTGSGKSTTLASMVEYINQHQARHIITIEDPVEYRFASAMSKVSQRQVGKDATSFQGALRAALRQDPDVVMIGEMRDKATVQTALDAANTGHLVLATLHTNNARQSIERMVSFFSAEEKDWAHQVISSVLIAVMSQVLVPSSNGNGRVLCYEFLQNTPAARQCIKEGKPQALYNIMETGRKDGQVLLNAHLTEKVRQGVISYEDAAYFAYDPVALEKELASDY